MNDAPYPFPHCGRKGCRCTHLPPCVCGWIDTDEKTVMCPVCRHDRLPTTEEKTGGAYGRQQWLARLRETNAKKTRNSSDDW